MYPVSAYILINLLFYCIAVFNAFKCCEILSPSHESAVLTMARPTSATQAPKATRPIRRLITSHHTRLMSYETQQRQQKQTYSRRESALINITRLPKHVSKKGYPDKASTCIVF